MAIGKEKPTRTLRVVGRVEVVDVIKVAFENNGFGEFVGIVSVDGGKTGLLQLIKVAGVTFGDENYVRGEIVAKLLGEITSFGNASFPKIRRNTVGDVTTKAVYAKMGNPVFGNGFEVLPHF